jgi:hypothetical protein
MARIMDSFPPNEPSPAVFLVTISVTWAQQRLARIIAEVRAARDTRVGGDGVSTGTGDTDFSSWLRSGYTLGISICILGISVFGASVTLIRVVRGDPKDSGAGSLGGTGECARRL